MQHCSNGWGHPGGAEVVFRSSLHSFLWNCGASEARRRMGGRSVNSDSDGWNKGTGVAFRLPLSRKEQRNREKQLTLTLTGFRQSSFTLSLARGKVVIRS